LARIDFLKSCNFKILLPQRDLEFFVQDVNIPGFTLGEMQINHWTQNEQRQGDAIIWNRLNLTVICDEDLKAFKEVYNHIIKEKNPQTGYLDPINTVFDATLLLTTNKSNVAHTIMFRYAWISNVGDLMLQTTSSEDEPPTFTMEIVYAFYEFVL
jgi:hypothetical protein